MTFEEANIILSKFDIFTVDTIHDLHQYIDASGYCNKATLDGEFTSEQLEAIALWMKCPESVVNYNKIIK
jgi:hypothetical protein